MSRPIDADALTGWILRELRSDTGTFNALTGRQAANLIGKAIDEAPTIGGWISVKDRLPPIYQMVLITGKNSAGGSFGVIKGSYDGHNYNWYRDDIGHYVNSRGDIVTYWMPLPEPPEE